ncbi:hypothetical protein DFQ29_008021, partial [Apophysomyces sp. BC1021]
METFRCGGQVSGHIDRVNDVINLNIEHSTGHPAPYCALNFSAHDLYERAIEDYPNETENLTCAQVYYWWSEGIASSYRLDSDEIVSSRLLIERAASTDVRKVFDRAEKGVSALGFVTPLFNIASTSPFVEEFH